MKAGDLVRYCPDAAEVEALGIEDPAIGVVITLESSHYGPLTCVKVLWAGGTKPDVLLVEDLEIIN